MAWVDDRIWCHPKLVDVSKPARWAWVAAITYSSGFQTRGKLTNGQVNQIHATAKERRELVTAGLWHEVEGGVEINDWDDHNSKRDDRRAKDRDRKRRERQRKHEEESPQDVTRDNAVTTIVTSGVTACVEGSEGSDGSDGSDGTSSSSKSDAVTRPDAPADADGRQPDISTIKTEIEQSLRQAKEDA